jgi:hypothetical protein
MPFDDRYVLHYEIRLATMITRLARRTVMG